MIVLCVIGFHLESSHSEELIFPSPLPTDTGISFPHRLPLLPGMDESTMISPHPERLREKLARSDHPYVTLKAAATLDGKIATRDGASHWITGETARRHVHRVRAGHDGILVGRGTLAADDPRLTVRLDVPSPSPARVVLTSTAQVPLEARALHKDGNRRIVIAGSETPGKRLAALEAQGVEVILCEGRRPGAAEFLTRLRGAGIESLLVEGGGQVHGHLIAQGLADELLLYLAGCMLGDSEAPAWCGPLGVTELEKAPRLQLVDSCFLGGDLLLRGFFWE